MVSLLLTVRPGAKRTFGFDTPDRDHSSAGKMFSGTTVGHLGFTGVSMWLDVAYGIMVLLFTNRVHPDRNNNAIKMFRPLLHDAVMEAVLGAGHYQNQNESAGFKK
jgi:CubicO group peptidase (beta-lactamase class C family)